MSFEESYNIYKKLIEMEKNALSIYEMYPNEKEAKDFLETVRYCKESYKYELVEKIQKFEEHFSINDFPKIRGLFEQLKTNL